MVRDLAPADLKAIRAAIGAELRRLHSDLLREEIPDKMAELIFAHACRLGAEGIVSKKTDSTYRSGRCPVWIKVRNPASIAVQRERSEIGIDDRDGSLSHLVTQLDLTATALAAGSESDVGLAIYRGKPLNCPG
jgi:hypothetical protein